MNGFLRPDPEVVAAYVAVRGRIVELLRTTPESLAVRVVPHCAAWTVSELASHVVGVVDDILAGRLEGVTTEAWTQAQVERLRGRSLSQLADHYEESATAFDAVLPLIPSPVNSQLVMDAVTHEHDLRHALDRAGSRDAAAVDVGLGWLLDRAAGGQPALAGALVGSGLSAFDLLRSLTGRRSMGQIEALGLDAVAIAALLAGSPLRPPQHDIPE